MHQKTDISLVDTHAHLDFPEFDQDRDAVIEQAKIKGIDLIVNIGSSLEGSKRSVELAKKYPCIYAAVGLHPHEADQADENAIKEIKELAKKDKVVAIGETGLDYFKNFSAGDNQRKLFYSLIDLAKEFNLPLVIHSRQAQDDTLSILREKMPLKAVVHCFSGDESFLAQCLELGIYISFTCNITYKKAAGLRELMKVVPLDRLMLETDAPYLSPEGFRGKRNDPSFVRLLAEEIAKIRGMDVSEIARSTTENARRFFGL